MLWPDIRQAFRNIRGAWLVFTGSGTVFSLIAVYAVSGIAVAAPEVVPYGEYLSWMRPASRSSGYGIA